MIPAPAQGAILAVCRSDDQQVFESCHRLHHESTAFCVKIERDFLSTLLGGCSTPIGALALPEENEIFFRGVLLDDNGRNKVSIEKRISVELAASLGISAAQELLSSGGNEIFAQKQHA